MSASKVQANWSDVVFNTTTTFDGVTSAKIDLGGEVQTFKADGDIYDIVAASLTRRPTLSVTHADVSLGMALIPGASGVMTMQHNDAKLASSGAVLYTITSAVFENCADSGDHAAWGSAVATFKTVTADGATAPVALTRVEGAMDNLVYGRADAVIIPERLKQGRRMYHRLDSIIKIAHPLLGTAPAGRDLIYIRRMDGVVAARVNGQAFGAPGDSMLFVTRDSKATLLYAKADPKGRRGPRYRWEGNGCMALGYLLDDEDKGILYA